MRLLRRSACLLVVGALLTGGGAIALADPSDQPNQWEWYGDPPQNAELHFGSKSPTGGPLEASGGLASDDCGAVPAWGPGELAVVRRQFTYSGPMSDGRSTIDLHGVMNGSTITGTVRFHVVGEWCVIDTPELSFTAKCVSENRCAQKRTRSARGNPGNGLIKPFVSIGGVKIGMTKAATRGVLGPPVGWPPRGSRASSSCIYRWRETEIQVFFGFLRRPCGDRSAVTSIDYVNGSQRRFTQKTPSGAGLGSTRAAFTAAIPARVRCTSSRKFTHYQRFCGARKRAGRGAVVTEFDLQGDKVVNISILRCQYAGRAVPHDAPRTAVFFDPCGSDFYGKQLLYAPRP